MALELIKNPQGGVDAGIFNLPHGFDVKKWAAEWVEESQVAFKQQRQSVPDTGMSADGWEIYKHEDSKKPYKVVNGKDKTFVLMVRPRIIQDQVNALCGNVSKQRISREIKGETVAGNAPVDSGMLPESRLKETGEGSSFEGGDTQLNAIPESVITT